MKKFISVLFVVVIIATVFISCGGKETKSGAAIQTDKLESVSVGDDKIYLKYNFSKGEKFKYKLTTISSNDEIIEADSTIKSKGNQKLVYVFDCEVIDVDEDNIAELTLKVSDIKFNAEINGEKVSYSTSVKVSDEEKLKFMEYETISNTPYRARINQYGEVMEVSRIEKMVEKMNDMSPQKQNLTTEQKLQYAKQLGETAIRPITQMLFREMPKNNVGKDTSWSMQYPQQLGTLKIDNTAKYTVVDFVKAGDSKAAKINANLTAVVSGERKATENGVTYSFGEPKISGYGTIIFDYETGKLLKADTGTEMKMAMSIEGKDSMQKLRKTKRTTTSSNNNIVELL
ncbi:MAG: hypothetical protein FD143_155 [Ignavibacteria bacterium]|nr:MAG: hypothetical protein FD143_155 [Ignavibacteria bacterium]KAF0162430.1 MAG: hypothetical protein FD188_33 [Ignavibacteria bacterium]